MVTLLLCYDCRHCWYSKKVKDSYQCSQCGSRQVAVAPSLRYLVDLVREDYRSKIVEKVQGEVDCFKRNCGKLGKNQQEFVNRVWHILGESDRGEPGRSATKGVASESDGEQPEISQGTQPKVSQRIAPAPNPDDSEKPWKDWEVKAREDYLHTRAGEYPEARDVDWLRGRFKLSNVAGKELLQRIKAYANRKVAEIDDAKAKEVPDI